MGDVFIHSAGLWYLWGVLRPPMSDIHEMSYDPKIIGTCHLHKLCNILLSIR